MWKTGHSLIKAKMRETDAELAGALRAGDLVVLSGPLGAGGGVSGIARLVSHPSIAIAMVPPATSSTPQGLCSTSTAPRMSMPPFSAL